MATFSEGSEVSDSVIHLNCTVCLETFKDPKVLPCLHTFCTGCLGRILSSSTNSSPGVSASSLTCPQCRAEHAIPEGGVESFLTNFSIADLVQIAELKEQGGEGTTVCEECDSGEPASAHCTQCCSYICEYCSGTHKKMKQFRDHDVISLQDVNHEKLRSRSRPHYCLQHPKEVLKMYCRLCNILVCCDCVVNAHQGHTFGSIGMDTRSKVEEVLEEMTCSAKKTLAEFSRNLKYVKEVEKVTTANTTKLKAEINAVFDRYVATIESHRASLLEEGEDKYNTNVKELWAQKEYIERGVEGLSSTLRFTECLRQCKGNSEMLRLAAQAIPQLKEMKDIKWDPATVSDIESKYISLKSGNHLDTCQMDSLKESYDLLDIVFRDSLPDNVTLGMRKQLDLVVMRSLSKRPAVLREQPIVKITFFGKSLPAEVTRRETGHWSVAFTPVCGGLHTVSARIETKSSKWKFTVTGKPKIGSRVCKGPHWHYSDNVDLGTVVDKNTQHAPDYNLIVNWDVDGDIKSFHRWRTDAYDVQLVL